MTERTVGNFDSDAAGRLSSPLAASFRDPKGALLVRDGRVLRIITPEGQRDLGAFLSSGTAAKLVESGAIVRTSVLSEGEKNALLEDPGLSSLWAGLRGEAIVEHERIPFPSYPYEWAPEMLHRAAALTLDLALDLLPESLGLKDATPYNILFRGPEPVFVDVLSFERREPGDPVWLPYAQFVRTFLLPLLLSRRFGLPLDQLLLTRRDGIEPEEAYRWLGRAGRLRPPFFSLVTMPVWLAKRHSADDATIYTQKLLANHEKARFIVNSILKGLKRTVHAAAPAESKSSAWTGYMEFNNNYSAEHFAAKEQFVQDCLAAHPPRSVLDVGCNTGHFSFLAARSGARVVSIDYDPAVVGAVWRKAAADRLPVLPLVVNLTRPTPGAGWMNRECPSFLDRARGAFDAVFMLAVIHHMLVTERVPLDEIVELAAGLTTDLLIVEFVAPEDSMFRRLVRGREELHRGLNAEVFESSCRRRFDIMQVQHLEGTHRWLYLMRRKAA